MNVKKRNTSFQSLCEPKDFTKRVTISNFLNSTEVEMMLDFAKRGMEGISENGPTIMDPDLNLVLGAGAKLKEIKKEIFTEDDLKLYGSLMKRIQDKVMEIHKVSKLYHTAPTFIARLNPFLNGKTATHIHDEYWHIHADKNNTDHYDYSALVYLSDHGKDFEGGLFEFHDENGKIITVKPEKGMFITFSSSHENAHRVTLVTKGTRFAWSTWWTCDSEKKFLKSRLNFQNDEL